jgi:hypothetical protein
MVDSLPDLQWGIYDFVVNDYGSRKKGIYTIHKDILFLITLTLFLRLLSSVGSMEILRLKQEALLSLGG